MKKKIIILLALWLNIGSGCAIPPNDKEQVHPSIFPMFLTSTKGDTIMMISDSSQLARLKDCITNDDYKAKIDSLEMQLVDVQESKIEKKEALWIFFLTIIVLVIVVILFINKYKKEITKSINNLLSNAKPTTPTPNPIPISKPDNQPSMSVKDLQERVAVLEDKIERLKDITIPVEDPKTVLSQQPKFFYAEAIVNGKFNGVTEQSDDDNTIFELILNQPTDMQARISIYTAAHKRIIARPSAFLVGCKKQILGRGTTVTLLREGMAQKNDNGEWEIKTPPEVKID